MTTQELTTTTPDAVIVGVPMMDEAEARETIEQMRGDIGMVDHYADSFRRRALEFADRRGWDALGYTNAAEAINAELGTQYSKSYISRLLQAAEIEKTLELPIGNSVPETQLRPLASLDSPAQQRQAWQAANATTNGKPTTKAVQQAVQEIKPKPLSCVRCGAERTLQRSLTTYGTDLVPEYPGRAVTLCSVCIPELLQLRRKAEQAGGAPATTFWQTLSHAHPTAHLWSQEEARLWRSACGVVARTAPAGSRDGGHCSSCVRATWQQNKPALAPEPPATPPAENAQPDLPPEYDIIKRRLAAHDQVLSAAWDGVTRRYVLRKEGGTGVVMLWPDVLSKLERLEAEPDPDPSAPAFRMTCPTCGETIMNGVWGDLKECGSCYHARAQQPPISVVEPPAPARLPAVPVRPKRPVSADASAVIAYLKQLETYASALESVIQALQKRIA